MAGRQQRDSATASGGAAVHAVPAWRQPFAELDPRIHTSCGDVPDVVRADRGAVAFGVARSTGPVQDLVGVDPKSDWPSPFGPVGRPDAAGDVRVPAVRGSLRSGGLGGGWPAERTPLPRQ